MIGIIITLIALPVLAAFIVNSMSKQDKEEDKRRAELANMKVRFFRLKKPTLVLCHNHLTYLKTGQVALVSDKNCKVCLDNPGKV